MMEFFDEWDGIARRCAYGSSARSAFSMVRCDGTIVPRL